MTLKLMCTAKSYAYLRMLFGDRLQLPLRDKVAAHIFYLIKSKTADHNNPMPASYRYEYHIDVPKWLYDACWILDLSVDKTVQINHYLFDKFREAFFLRLHELVYVAQPAMKIMPAIYLLQAEWNLPDEITADSLKKEYYRYRIENQKIFKKNTSWSVPFVYTESNDLDANIIFRINSSLKQDFQNKCQLSGLDMTDVFGHFINRFLNE